jgi:exopolyphosphatase/pppGpp-phosphohydrolase
VFEIPLEAAVMLHQTKEIFLTVTYHRHSAYFPSWWATFPRFEHETREFSCALQYFKKVENKKIKALFEAQRTGRARRYGREAQANDILPAVTHTEDFT